jgi:hypothetical protein
MSILILWSLWLVVLIGLPPLMIWGWVRWAKRTQPRTAFSIMSWAGLSLATLSALLAISTLIYAQAIGGFPLYDPLLLKIYRWGLSISLVGIICAIGGIWRAGPVRWHAPACTAGMLLFWFLAAISE